LAIDIGAAAINRATNSDDRPRIEGSNPANADGTIDTVKVWMAYGTTTFQACIQEHLGSNVFTTRDYEDIGSVSSGSEQTFTGLSMDVVTGDYLGCDYQTGNIEADTSGGTGIWWDYTGTTIPCTNETFQWVTGTQYSLYGMGTEGGGATEKTGSDTGTGAETKASGNPLAAINGGETGSGADWLPGRDIALPDTGAGVDALVSLQTPAAKTASDAGSGVEGTPLSGAVLVDNETGIGVDALVSVQTPVAKTSSDAGSGVEAIPVPGAVLAGSESGAGIEAFIARLLAAAETGYGAEASEIGGGGLLKHLFASELGEGADGLTAKIEMSPKGGGMRLWT